MFKYKNERGQTLVFALVIVLIITIFTTTLVSLLRQETKWAVKHGRSTSAFHLAEAATDRGLWKLREGKGVWESVADGTLDIDYKGQKEFTDVEGGRYKITISTTSNEDHRKIVGVGRDSSTNETRSIEVIVAVASITSAVHSPTISIGGNAQVHWGPIESIGSITAGGDLYPRKYARGDIIGRTPPDTDNVEYWAYYSVPDSPEIDFQYYIDHADESYAGFKEFKNIVVSHSDADKIYYVDGNAQLKNSYLKGTLIVTGNLNLSGGGKGAYTANVPENAWEEYAKIDDATSGQYYADVGFQYSTNTFTFDGSTIKISFEGFIYIGGDWTGTGNQDFNGCVICKGSMAGLTGNVNIFYNDDIAAQVETKVTDFTQESWKEIKQDW